MLRHDDGEVRRRLDLAYPQARLVIEYDGRQHAESTRQWQGDVRRREELDGDGWRLVVLLAPDIYRTPQHTLGRIRAAMHQCGMPLSPESEEWRALRSAQRRVTFGTQARGTAWQMSAPAGSADPLTEGQQMHRIPCVAGVAATTRRRCLATHRGGSGG